MNCRFITLFLVWLTKQMNEKTNFHSKFDSLLLVYNREGDWLEIYNATGEVQI